jgi:putative ABC transport system substrate-binding protein
MFVVREFANAGGLLSYGPDVPAMFRRVAEYVDAIANGAKPANLPVEQLTKFELVVNVKTTEAIGPDIPDMLLALAKVRPASSGRYRGHRCDRSC